MGCSGVAKRSNKLGGFIARVNTIYKEDAINKLH
jgi:hypothetical protein